MTRKIRLELDALVVDGFAVEAPGAPRGTVDARFGGASESTCLQDDCTCTAGVFADSCAQTCNCPPDGSAGCGTAGSCAPLTCITGHPHHCQCLSE